MHESSMSLFLRKDYLVGPVSIYIWPESVYDMPFFVSMENWVSLVGDPQYVTSTALFNADRGPDAIVVLEVSSSSPQHDSILLLLNSCDINSFSCMNARVNVSSLCHPTKNVLSLANASLDVMNVDVSIELRVRIPIDDFIRKIPWDEEDLLSMKGLSLSSTQGLDEDMKILRESRTNICPITLQPMEVAVKGKNCLHRQLFDAKSFIMLGNATNKWSCPICGKPLDPEELIRCSLG